jgi:hypothetical protein
MNWEDNEFVMSYVSDGQRNLLKVGFHLRNHVNSVGVNNFDDYSFVVFPFAKAYEGFLKQAFLDMHFINDKDFVSKFFRIGRVLSPNLVKKNGLRSVYKKICDQYSTELADMVWNTWKISRNEVFHYFPHNIRSLTLEEADHRISLILESMESIIKVLKV